jgi:aspartyl-tRNA(Asn)/glutamyl-tRNA(Gln) amidotransferase subunit A
MSELTHLSLAALREMLDGAQVSHTEMMNEFLSRAAAVAHETNCFAFFDGEAALAAADRLERLRGEGAGVLSGIPFAYKDVFADGRRAPHAGSLFDDLCADREPAAVLQSLKNQDAIGIGALALDELSYGATGLNSHFGHVRNPWDTRYIAGGSSGGAAAAIAARAIPFAVAADTGGSIRIPAALCGVVGLKPTLGRFDNRGMVPLSPSQDTIGVIARTAEDCALALQGLSTPRAAGVPWNTAMPGSVPTLAGLRVGVCKHEFFDIQNGDGAAVIADALRVLQSLGATLHDQPLPDIDQCDAAATVITWIEVFQLHRDRLRDTPQRLSDATRLRLEAALAATPGDYGRACAYRPHALKRFMSEVFANCDVLVCPTVTAPAQTIETLAGDAAACVRLTGSFLKSNRCFNYLGLPALSMPVGFDALGLPVGLQMIGRPWSDEHLLRCCDAYQRVTHWHFVAPRIAADVASRVD